MCCRNPACVLWSQSVQLRDLRASASASSCSTTYSRPLPCGPLFLRFARARSRAIASRILGPPQRRNPTSTSSPPSALYGRDFAQTRRAHPAASAANASAARVSLVVHEAPPTPSDESLSSVRHPKRQLNRSWGGRAGDCVRSTAHRNRPQKASPCHHDRQRIRRSPTGWRGLAGIRPYWLDERGERQ